MVRNKDGTAKAASNATDNIDDADTQPTQQFLQVSHEQQLKDHAQQQLQNPASHTHVHTLAADASAYFTCNN